MRRWLAADFRSTRNLLATLWVSLASNNSVWSSLGIVAMTCKTFSVRKLLPLAEIDSSFG